MGITIALAGNPNCGKTTMFNLLTGSNQYVGNWPGVTVEKKEGKLKGHKDVTIVDLPGIYSLSPYTLEEVVTRDYIINEKPDVILNLVDASNIERNLYLTTQLLEMGIPTVIALNMIDIVKKRGDKIDVDRLSKEFGCIVVETSALKGTGVMKAAEEAIKLSYKKAPQKIIEPFASHVEAALTEIENIIYASVMPGQKRWFAVKLFERDDKATANLTLTKTQLDSIEQLIVQCEKTEDDTSESIITNERYNYISKLMPKFVVKKSTENLTVSDKIDKVVTNRFLALPIFVAIMFIVYYVSVTSLGTVVTDWTNDTLFGAWIQPGVQGFLENVGASEWVISLVVDGIIGGIGAPIGFAPQMAIVFLFLSVLEDCGYMARVAFIMDRIFRKFGLSGKSFIPFLISSGCGVPGIMATRTIENEKDRRMTIITTTAIPCGAKLPVIALIAGFLMGGAWWMAPVMYFTGVITVIVSCIILKKTSLFAGEPAPFVMELPQYHIPSVNGVLIHVWERVWAFLKKAGTILFLCCAVMWFLSSFGVENGVFGLVETENSLMASLGNALAWIFKPLGFGTWQAVASSISGFVAKEGIVSTMGVLSGLGEVEEYAVSMHSQFAAFFPTSIAAVSFLLFNMFDSPCLAAISTMAREMGSRKFFWFAILFQNVLAYCVSLMVYQLGGLILGQVAFGTGTIAALIVLGVMLFLLFRPDPNKRRSIKVDRVQTGA